MILIWVCACLGVEVTATANLDEAQLSSNMALSWSDEDGEVTVKERRKSHNLPWFHCVIHDHSSLRALQPVASPSPVFPAETESRQAASPPTGPNRRYESIRSILLSPVGVF